MPSLRQARFLARLVLAWFALAIGVAVAAPVVQPKAAGLLVCSGGTMKLLVQGDGDDTALTLDCPLCATPAGPPPVIAATGVQVGLSYAVQPVPAARLAARTAAPPPARGPPAPPVV